MSRGIGRSKTLARIALLLAAILLATAACGTTESPGNGQPQARFASERERLLATCPAEAQGFSAWQQDLAEKEGLKRPVHENDVVLDPVAAIAADYLRTLPADQRGGVAIDSVRDRVIVQVTRGSGDVLADLREKVEAPHSVVVETVRWSGEDLAAFAERLETIPGSGSWVYGFGNANARIEVDVPGDAADARRRITDVIDPCAFTVKGNAKPIRPT